MKTTKTNNDVLHEGAKAMEKLLNDSNTVMMDNYNKQMNLADGFYKNLFNSGNGNIYGLDQNGGVPSMFADSDIAKVFTNLFANFSEYNAQNPMLRSIDKTMKQVLEINQQILSSFTTGVQNKGINSESMNEEYKNLLEDRLKDSKEMLHAISEACNKQLESSMATNNETMEEISNQFSLSMKKNQQLWEDMLNAHQTSQVKKEMKEKVVSSKEGKIRSEENAPVKIKKIN